MTAILLGLIAWFWFRPPADVSTEDRTPPPWSVTTTDGRVLTSETLKGKVVLVSFWATWCPYCRKEKPVIEDWWREHRDRGFEVVAVSIDDTPAALKAWMAEHDYRQPTAAMTPSVAAAFGPVNSVPTSFVVDRDGHIRHRIGGQLHSGRLDDLVLPLLAP